MNSTFTINVDHLFPYFFADDSQSGGGGGDQTSSHVANPDSQPTTPEADQSQSSPATGAPPSGNIQQQVSSRNLADCLKSSMVIFSSVIHMSSYVKCCHLIPALNVWAAC